MLFQQIHVMAEKRMTHYACYKSALYLARKLFQEFSYRLRQRFSITRFRINCFNGQSHEAERRRTS
jgi:hypothetical protein